MGLRNTLRRTFADRYDDFVSRSRPSDDIPNRVQRFYNNLTGYEYAAAIEHLVGDAHRVLVIGDGGGRDFFWLRQHGKDVVAFDIAPQPVIPRLVLGDVTRGLPFKDASFDAVVMAEVVEHLFEDWEALREARRILGDDGVMVVTVPFGNDLAEYHVRVHTPRTIVRLLRYGGFEVTELIYKGGGWSMLDNGGVFTVAKHLVAMAVFYTSGRSIYEPLLARLARSDMRSGRKPALRHRISSLYGGMLAARPSTTEFDVRELNRSYFSDLDHRLH